MTELDGIILTQEQWKLFNEDKELWEKSKEEFFQLQGRAPNSGDELVGFAHGLEFARDAAKELLAGIRVEGIVFGLTAFAWHKDGEQFVGTCGYTLQKAIQLAEAGELPNQIK